MKNEKVEYYLGLDIGTNSVGWAVTDKEYNILKFHGKPAWGATVFDEASLSAERRGFRTARRRLDRRQQRVLLVQELFSKEISKIDPRFYIRLQESYKYREEVGDKYTLFNDVDFTDRDYYAKYPTIHHLIVELMKNQDTHDARLVYLACAWLVAHRGHFLSNIDINNISNIKDFETVYLSFEAFFAENGFEKPWEQPDINELGNVLKRKTNITTKTKELKNVLFGEKKPSKEYREEFPFNLDCIIKLLAGGTVKLKDLFFNDEYSEIEVSSISLGMDEEKFATVMSAIGDDYDLISALRGIYDWTVLVDVLGTHKTISEAKVEQYEQHKKDLKTLKYFIKKYLNSKYNEVFRVAAKETANYVAYSYHTDNASVKGFKKNNKEDFSTYVLKVISDIQPEERDADAFADMKTKLETRSFMPKQKNTDNRVIPYQLYLYELRTILDNACKYLPLLNEIDERGMSVKDKIESVFSFRIPYYVGPLNNKSAYSWMVRKENGKILPWNFEEKVDLDESETAFIKRMTNRCTYLPDQPVLPKCSLLYQKFMVLNIINCIRINGKKISVELKQNIYNDLFLNNHKVTKRKIYEYLLRNGLLEKNDKEAITGIDDNIGASLSSHIAYKKMLSSGLLTEKDVERIIERSTYSEDKNRLKKWLEREYGNLPEEDRSYICKIKAKDFGRLSKHFLNGIEGTGEELSGEAHTVISALWNTQCNIMEVLSDRFSFGQAVNDYQKEYYDGRKVGLNDRLDEMYISNAVKRPIFRTFDIIGDVTKAFGQPKKIFIEMARGGTKEQKGKRTKSRREQIEELYKNCKEDVKELSERLASMGDSADTKLQSEKLFLYFMQLGRCAYSGKIIDFEKLFEKTYDVDHIYPQAYVKDDSIVNNKVLCLSEENGKKQDRYPIDKNIRDKMYGFWKSLKDSEMMSDEKFKRLTRTTGFTEEEKYGFINRQLTETSQSTKAVAILLKEKFPDTELIYSKAGLVSDYRHEYQLFKSRIFNDLHHAKDAYLNIVVGNVYDMKFTKKWFNINDKYSIKTKTIFKNPTVINGVTVWRGEEDIEKVKKTLAKNNANFTKYAFFKTGGLFDQMPVPADKGLTPLKQGRETIKYGGYKKAGGMFFIPVKYFVKTKSEILIMSVELLVGKRFIEDENFAKEYAFARIKRITGKDADTIEFPMGLRPWKVNTVLALDGFRICISGGAGGGKCLIAQPVVQFSADAHWEYYLKKLEEFYKKTKENKTYKYDPEYDKVSFDENNQLYDIYLVKLQESIYKKRINAPTDNLKNGKEIFENLSIEQQAEALLNIHGVFGRVSSGCDLSLIGGKSKAAATVNFSSSVSNWKKSYSDVRLVDSSVTGLWEKKSENILDLL